MQSVFALQLGQIAVESYLNEPLNASIPLNNVDPGIIEDIKVDLADLKSYDQLQLSRPHYLTQLKFNILAGEETRHSIQVTTKERIREPIMEVLIKVSDKQNIVMRLFTLMMDLRDSAPVSSVVADTSRAIASPVVETKQVESAPTPLPVDSQPSQQVPASSQPEIDVAGTIQVKDQSISIIAQNSPLAQRYSVYQIMRAFYLLNPNAFWKENINLLHSGVNLVVPDEEFVNEVTRQQAVNFVYSVSRDFPGNNEQLKTSGQQSTEVAQQVKPLDTVQPVTSAEPRINTEKEFTISEDIRDDIKSWKSLVGELKAITSALNRQNKAIQVQNSVIEEMNSRLETKANDIEQLNLRMNALENMGQSTVLSRNTADVSSDWTPVTQTLDEVVAETSPSNESGNVENGSPSVQLNNTLNARSSQQVPTASVMDNKSTESQIMPATGNASAVESQPEIIPVPQIVVTEERFTPLVSNRNLYWVLAVLVLVIMVIVVVKWMKSRKVAPPQSNPVTRKPTSEKVIQSSQPLLDDQELELDLDLHADLEDETKPKKRRPKGEVTNFEDTYEVIQVPVVSSKSKLNLELDSEDNVHAEIDLLVAYQEYEEARNLLESAREKFSDDHWLDIMELKILAYSKDVDMFFFKLEKYKDKLSTEYPMQWEKILLMRDKLNLELTKSKAAII